MEAIVVGLLVLAVVTVPLGLSVWSDRRREQADMVAAAARSAVRQRLEGEAFVTVNVTPPHALGPGSCGPRRAGRLWLDGGAVVGRGGPASAGGL